MQIPVLKIFKLHGSANWSRIVELPAAGGIQAVIQSADRLKLSGAYVQTNEGQADYGKMLIVPCIAMPVQIKSKDAFACPPEHILHLKTLLPGITKILIVGWHAREAHFLDLLKENLSELKQLMVVSGNATEAKRTLDYFVMQVGEKAGKARGYIGLGGFTDFVVNREGDEFFRA